MPPRLFLLGTPRLVDRNGAHVRLPTRAYALAAMIALSPDRTIDRAHVASVLWGETATRLGSLRKLLWNIRAAVSESGVQLMARHDIALAFGEEDLQVDVFTLLALEGQNGVLSLGDLARIYRGDLLEGIEFESPLWDDWLRGQRQRLQALFVENVSRELETCVDTHGPVRLLARRLIEIDPYNETACRRLINIHLREGDKAQALKVYEDLTLRLRSDLKAEPTDETTRLIEAVFGRDTRAAPWQPQSLEGSIYALAQHERPKEWRPEPTVPQLQSLLRRPGVPTLCLLRPNAVGRAGRLEHLAQSLIDDVTIGFCRSKEMRVMAPHTSWKLAASEARDQRIAELGIDYVVDTDVQRVGGIGSLSVKLLRVASREIIWAERMPFEPLAAAQHYHDLSLRILSSIRSEVERFELRHYANIEHPTAYFWYLLGQRHMAKLDLPSIRRGRQALKSSLSASANFVPAISALARSYTLEWLLLSRGDDSVLARAEQFARQAIAIDDQDASGFREIGNWSIYQRRYDESLEAFASAEALHPQHADLLADHADALVHASEMSAALTKIRQAMRMNPLCPDLYFWIEAGAHYHSEDYAATIEAIGRMHNPNPAFRLLAAAHAMLGHKDDATSYVEQALDSNPNFQVSRWMDIVPLRRKAQARHYEYGLRSAGFQ